MHRLPEVEIVTEDRGLYEAVIDVKVDGISVPRVSKINVADQPNAVTELTLTILAGRVVRHGAPVIASHDFIHVGDEGPFDCDECGQPRDAHKEPQDTQKGEEAI